MVKIGIIVGKDDWYSDSPKDLKGIARKFLTKNFRARGNFHRERF